MKIVSTSYTNTRAFHDPSAWLDRIGFYTGILEKLAIQHEVHSIEQINYTGELKRNNVSYRFLNFKKPKLYFPRQLHHHIKKLQPDVVLVNGFIFPLQIIQLRFKLGRKPKIVVMNRSEKPFSGIRKYLQRLAGKCIDAILFTSAEFGQQWVENGNIKDAGKIHEVMHGSSSFAIGDANAARASLAITDPPVFLWVGRLNENKDPLTVVKGFLFFLKIQPAAKLYLVFQTAELLGKLKEMIGDKTASIILVGKIAHPQLESWYHAADFIISGSHYEGGGIAICEAMSCGCIPILTNIIAFRKLTGPGKAGLLYEPGNDASLLAVLLQTNDLNIAAERQKVLQQFKNELSFEAIQKKIESIITQLSN